MDSSNSHRRVNSNNERMNSRERGCMACPCSHRQNNRRGIASDQQMHPQQHDPQQLPQTRFMRSTTNNSIVTWNEYSYLVAFNNYGVTLLKQKKFIQAKHTFNEAFTIVKMILQRIKQDKDGNENEESGDCCCCCSCGCCLESSSPSTTNPNTTRSYVETQEERAAAPAKVFVENYSSRGIELEEQAPTNSCCECSCCCSVNHCNTTHSPSSLSDTMVTRLQRVYQWTLPPPPPPPPQQQQKQQHIITSTSQVTTMTTGFMQTTCRTATNGTCIEEISQSHNNDCDMDVDNDDTNVGSRLQEYCSFLVNFVTVNYELYPSSLPSCTANGIVSPSTTKIIPSQHATTTLLSSQHQPNQSEELQLSMLSITVHPIHIHVDCPIEEYITSPSSHLINEVVIVCHNIATTYFVMSLQEECVDSTSFYCNNNNSSDFENDNKKDEEIEDTKVSASFESSRNQSTSANMNSNSNCSDLPSSTKLQQQQQLFLQKAIAFYQLGQSILNDSSNTRYHNERSISEPLVSTTQQQQQQEHSQQNQQQHQYDDSLSYSASTDQQQQNRVVRNTSMPHSESNTTAATATAAATIATNTTTTPNSSSTRTETTMYESIRRIYNSYRIESILLQSIIQALTIQEYYDCITLITSPTDNNVEDVSCYQKNINEPQNTTTNNQFNQDANNYKTSVSSDDTNEINSNSISSSSSGNNQQKQLSETRTLVSMSDNSSTASLSPPSSLLLSSSSSSAEVSPPFLRHHVKSPPVSLPTVPVSVTTTPTTTTTTTTTTWNSSSITNNSNDSSISTTTTPAPAPAQAATTQTVNTTSPTTLINMMEIELYRKRQVHVWNVLHVFEQTLTVLVHTVSITAPSA